MSGTQDDVDVLFTQVFAFETRVGLPKGFWINLAKEDDWSFVIKLNALIESATTHALVARLGVPEAIECIAQLDLADTKNGKVAFLKSLGCTTPEQRRFISELAQLRNRLVHNIQNVSFSLQKQLRDKDAAGRRRFVETFGYVWRDPIPLEDKPTSLLDYTMQFPRRVMWLTAGDLIAALHTEYEISDIKAATREKEARAKLLQELNDRIPDISTLLGEAQFLVPAPQPPPTVAAPGDGTAP